VCGVDADSRGLTTPRAFVLVDQHVRDAARGEARVDREQLGLVGDTEYNGDGSRRSGTALASCVRDVAVPSNPTAGVACHFFLLGASF